MAVYIQFFLLLTLLITASVIDIKRREIPDKINIMIALTGLLHFKPVNLAGILIALPFLATAIRCKGRLGGGDIKFMAAAGLVLGFDMAVFAAITGLTASLIYCAVRHLIRIIRRKTEKKQSTAFPLAPFLSLGCMTAFLLQNGGLIL